MTSEARIIPDGTTVYVDGVAYTLMETRERLAPYACPPYYALTGTEPPRCPLGEERTKDGTAFWWLSYLRVSWDTTTITEVEHENDTGGDTARRSGRVDPSKNAGSGADAQDHYGRHGAASGVALGVHAAASRG